MEFSYTIDAYTNSPIMLIDRHIGNIGGDYGIMADQFCRELIQLDGMGKKSIQVWINSIGGVVMDGMQIFGAISRCKTPIETYNLGIAASSAAFIFQAGSKRIMSDYALMMIHNPFNPEGDDENGVMSKFKDSIITMLSNKCKKNRKDISSMMDAETWFDAWDCLEGSFCDEIESYDNSLNLSGISDINNKWAAAASVVNAAIQKQKFTKMNKVLNYLQLQEGSTEDVVLNAIEAIKNETEQVKEQLAEVNAHVEALNAEKAELEAKVQEAEAKEAEAKEAAFTAEATEVVNTFKSRIGEGNVDKWVNLYKSNPETTKELLEGLPLNVVAPKIEDEEPSKGYNMAAIMAEKSKNNN